MNARRSDRYTDTRDTIQRVRFWLGVVGHMIIWAVLIAVTWGLVSLASYGMEHSGLMK